MKKNVGTIDKALRLGVALLIAVLYFLDIITDTTAIVLGVLAIVFAITAFINFCPIWAALGINTLTGKKE